MNVRFAVALVGLAASALLAYPSHAQGVVRLPPGATPTAKETLTKMVQEMNKKKTYHMTLDFRQTVGSANKLHLAYVIDASLKPRLVNESITGTEVLKRRKKVSAIRVKALHVGPQAALRVNKAAWQCKSRKRFYSGAVGVAELFKPRYNKATVVGKTNVDGVAVWHVKTMIPMSRSYVFLFYSARAMNADLYVAQSDYRLVRIDASFKVNKPRKFSEQFTAHVSNVGKAVHVSLPKACA